MGTVEEWTSGEGRREVDLWLKISRTLRVGESSGQEGPSEGLTDGQSVGERHKGVWCTVRHKLGEMDVTWGYKILGIPVSLCKLSVLWGLATHSSGGNTPESNSPSRTRNPSSIRMRSRSPRGVSTVRLRVTGEEET